MPKYRFSEIAFNSTAKKKPTEADKDTYIGLEHLDSGSLTVSRWGSDVAPIGEKLIMKKGDVLFGKRRAYQKKVAIAPFDGIFSAHGMVLRPNEAVITQEYFPLFISSDYFLDEAIRISVGSLSPTVNWKDLKDLSFNIPTIEEQRRITPLVWAAIESKNAYIALLERTDELVKSQFIEMFGDPKSLDKENLTTIGELAEVVTGGTPSRRKPRYYNGTIPWVKTGEIEQGIIYDSEEYITEEAVQDTNCKILPVNTIMLAMYGVGRTRGQSGILKIEAATNQACAAILPNENYDPLFLLYYLRTQYEAIRQLGRGAQQTNLNLSLVKGYPIPIVSIEDQQRYAAFAEQADKSKFVAHQATLSTDSMIKWY